MRNIKEKGITLIALVVTIIILLILAGVTISAVINNNGIMQGAKTAVNVTNYQAAKEALTLKLMDIQADCTIKEIDYNLENINTELLKDDNFTVELYYYKETGAIRSGLTRNTEKLLKGVVVSVKKYEQYHFLLGEKGEITGVSIKDITDDTAEEDFKNIKEFEIEDIGITPSTPSSQGANPVTIENYGDKVNYSVKVNGIILDEWRLFYTEGNTAYIIYGEYLPNTSAIASSANLVQNKNYGVSSNTSREDLLDKLMNTSNWQSLLTDNLKNKGAKATGATTVDIWVKSWNQKYTNLTATYVDDPSSNSNAKAIGYLIGTDDPATTEKVSLSSDEGYSDTLYFPFTDKHGSCEAYWLGSYAAGIESALLDVDYLGRINDDRYNNGASNGVIGIRPVITIQANYLEKQSNGTWNIAGTSPISLRNYGDTVNYSVTVNGTVLDGWKILYAEGDTAYLIYDFYLPNATGIAEAAGLETSNSYCAYSNVDRNDLITKLQRKSNWEAVLTSDLKSKGAEAVGALTVEKWVEIWNSYSDEKITTTYTTDTNTYGAEGYLIGTENPATNYNLAVSSTGNEKGDSVFFPNSSRVDDCDGYFFASKSAYAVTDLMGMDSSNRTWQLAGHNYNGYSIRPVITLPAKYLEKQSNETWSITIAN